LAADGGDRRLKRADVGELPRITTVGKIASSQIGAREICPRALGFSAAGEIGHGEETPQRDLVAPVSAEDSFAELVGRAGAIKSLCRVDR
jgi:hypothetical protein